MDMSTPTHPRAAYQASPATPNTPDTAPPTAFRDGHAGVRRVHTLPAKSAGHSRNDSANSANAGPSPDSVEILFVHPQAKVVSFNVAGSGARPGSAVDRRSSIDFSSNGGTLAWEYPSERTLAAGPLRVYRVPSSGVSFLNSGLFLHPILKRSQCWLVDEECKFVLRVRDGLFYRVELPFAAEEEKALVEEFKRVLSTVLQYERTPSPFRRGFEQAVVESPRTPRRKSIQPKEKAKKWRLNKVWEPEDAEQRAQWSPQNRQEEDPASWRKHLRSRSMMVEATASDSASSHTTEDEGTATDESVGVQEEEAPPNVQTKVAHIEDESPRTPVKFSLPIHTRPDAMRSFTAPPHLVLDTTSRTELSPLSRISSRDSESDAASIASTSDSFYSIDEAAIAAEAQEEVGELFNHEHMATIKAGRSNHSRQISEITITPGSPTRHSEDARSHGRSTPTLISDTDDEQDLEWADAITPPDTLRMRRLQRPASSSSDPDQAHHLEEGDSTKRPLRRQKPHYDLKAPSRKSAISMLLVQKAYALVVGPSSQLVHLMLDIAARIVRSMQSARDLRLRKIPGAWNSSHHEEEEEDEYEDGEDDFGIPLDNVRRDSSREPGVRQKESFSGLGVGLRRKPSLAMSVGSDYDALIEGPMPGRVDGKARRDSVD